ALRGDNRAVQNTSGFSAVDSLTVKAKFSSSFFTITPQPLNSVDVKSDSKITEEEQKDLFDRPPP
ncbi:hypothetical protein, partial [uncultured Gimesia sp.]|uniref:hypothetical protein n=1 Tax=uncultured Gimesia sp. TaxID=1678688 RepID=UPI0030DC4777